MILSFLLLVLPQIAGLDLSVSVKADPQPFVPEYPFTPWGNVDVDFFMARTRDWGLFRQLPSSEQGNTCWCKTLAIIGDEGVATQFKSFMDTEYANMKEYYRRVRNQFFTNPDFVPGFSGSDAKVTWVECPSSNTDPFFRTFASVSDLEDFVGQENYGDVAVDRSPESNGLDRLCGAVVFPQNVLSDPNPEIRLRFNLTWNRAAQYSGFLTKINLYEDTRGSTRLTGQTSARYWYTAQGFIGVQLLVQRFLRLNHNDLQTVPQDGSSFIDTLDDMVNWQLFPFPAYDYSGSEALELLSNFQFVLLFCYATTVALTIGRVVREREQKLREYMKMMGLYDVSYYVAWVIVLGLTWMFIALTVTGMQFIYAFKLSSFGLVFMFNFLFGLASMSFSLFISSLCTRERLGSIIGAFVFFIGQAIKAPDYSKASLFNGASLLPPSAFIMGTRTLFFLETTGKGLTRDSLDTKYVGYSIHMSLSMLAVDIFFWWILYYYVEQVNPFLTGYRRVWYFPFTKLYWKEVLGMDTHRPLTTQDTEVDSVNVGPKFETVTSPQLLEMERTGNCVRVRNLRKRFGPSFYAVDGINLTMYSNEIFCLLGSNGAGKSTTQSMLTGMLAPTSGSIKALGMDIPRDMGELRRSLGVCPQHSALWSDLTVREHLWIFGGIRGLSRKELEPTLNSLIAEVGLGGRGNFQARALSGGMKRKLSVGIAFVGDPKIVFLDEPTSGMDPFARRSTWDLLKRKRYGRVICLTTHYMDEADVLGDRIAIMSNGKLACAGTSPFLKKIYGLGYLLSFVKEKPDTDVHGTVAKFVEQFVGSKNVRPVSAIGKELILEVIAEDEAKFADLLEHLDQPEDRAKLGIQSYGISVTNIEEVFLKVAGGQEDKPAVSGDESPRSPVTSPRSLPTVPGKVSFWQQFKALFERRVRYGLRDKQLFFLQIALPFLILLITLGFLLAALDQTPTPISLSVANLNPDYENANFVRFAPIENTSEVDMWTRYCDTGNTTRSTTACNLFANPGLVNPGLISPYEFQQALLEPWPYAPDPFFAFSIFNNTDDPQSYRPQLGIWQNSTGIHTAALAPLMHFNAWASQAGVEMKLVNDPFPNTLWEKQASNSISGAIATQMVVIAMSFLPTAVISFIVMEKEREVKNQLAISGVSPSAFWLSHFAFDTLVSIVSTLMAVIVFWIYKIDGFTTGDNLAGSFSILLLYGPASTAFAHVCSFFFSRQFIAQSFIAIISFIMGNLLVILSYVLQLIPEKTCGSCASIGTGVMWAGRLFPPFALGSGFYRLTVYVAPLSLPLTSSEIFGGCKRGVIFRTLDCFSGIGDDLFFLGLMTFVYVGISIFVDYLDSVPALRNYFVIKDDLDPADDKGVALEDANVIAEKQRVDRLNKTSPMLYVNRLRKIFRRAGTTWKCFWAGVFKDRKTLVANQVYAVESVSFAADKGEVFGLLGVNGAGKTSTFKMLCGLYCPSGGEIYVLGQDAQKKMDLVRQHVGYCPQFDALWDLLSTEEHVLLYAKIRGYEGADLETVVKSKLMELDLVRYKNARAGSLSGGNKRKLSVAMALVGEPELVFLDEPSCGMDPFARRSMWGIIESVADKRKQSLIVLTTHSMEEAEALCTRIAIQVDGRFRCLASCQEIKTLYGEGFEITIRAKSTNAVRSVDDMVAAIQGGSKDGLLTKTEAKDYVETNEKQAARLRFPQYGLATMFDEYKDISVYDVAEWMYKDQIFNKVIDFLVGEFGADGFEIIEQHGLVLKVKVAKILVSRLFRKFISVKDEVCIEDFQISQTTLEQIFNKFAATAVNRQD